MSETGQDTASVEIIGVGVVHYQFFDAGNRLVSSGNALSLWECQGNTWRIYHHWGVGDSEPK